MQEEPSDSAPFQTQLSDGFLFEESANELTHLRGARIFKITELTLKIKTYLESNETFKNLWVRGEISNFTHHTSGHMYFNLKDENSQLSCVMFKGNVETLKFEPKHGLKVIARGNISVYERRGAYQLYVRELLPDGLGALYLEYLQLKEKLSKEGLFAIEHKQPLPKFPKAIGVVTSPTGAALRDIINISTRRYPGVHLVIAPTRVQGTEAAAGIVRAIELLNRFGKVDVIIVTRGGGSLEDLWAFNEEPVARAIFNSKIPVLSAVGHETDFTIADFVADKRAPTPSAAAELTVPDITDVMAQVANFQETLILLVQRMIQQYRLRLDSIMESPAFKRPFDRIAQYKQHLDDIITQFKIHITSAVKLHRKNLEGLVGKLESLSPRAVLERGYSIAIKLPEEKLIRSVQEVGKGSNIQLIMKDGELTAKVDSIKKTDKEDK
jgi:exodeoxyribonuclease VII large subunit